MNATVPLRAARGLIAALTLSSLTLAARA